jgi:hypothetical protein
MTYAPSLLNKHKVVAETVWFVVFIGMIAGMLWLVWNWNEFWMLHPTRCRCAG